MGKSFKRNQFWKWNDSDKSDKVSTNKAMRRSNKILVVNDEGDTVYPNIREISDNWTWQSDGGPQYEGPQYGGPKQIIYKRRNRKRIKIIDTNGYKIHRK